jgi:protease PrsW
MITAETILPTSILAAAVPTLFFVALIYWVDRYEKEPLWLLGATFLWGAIPSIIIAFIFNTVLSIPVYLLVSGPAGDALAGSLIAPPVEETVKGLAILGILLLWRHEIDSVLDGIIYGAMVGNGLCDGGECLLLCERFQRRRRGGVGRERVYARGSLRAKPRPV